MKISLKLSDGTTETRSFRMKVVSIGRSKSSDFTVTDDSLSRIHCLIEINNGEFFITDLNSSNGVYLDNLRILPNKRISFSTFVPLSIGQLECQVTDEENTFDRTLTTIPGPPWSKGNSTLKENKSKKEKSYKSKNNNLITYLIYGVIFIIAVYANHVLNSSKKDIKHTIALLDKNVPEQFKEVGNNFLTEVEYENIRREIDCQDKAMCQELNLSSVREEGYKKKSNEIYIYQSSQKIQNEDSARSELRILSHLFRSQTFKDFQEKKIAQIHLILMNDEEKKIYKVLRFHIKHYTNNERYRLLSELSDALESGQEDKFWSYAQPIIQNHVYSY